MTGDVLTVDDVGKAYYAFDSELQRFARWLGVPVAPTSERWALRHVGLRLHAGEAVGIVGQNGAGKSTLLKLITGTAHPNEGTINVSGRVSALLELGLGFNPELTGRENVRHVGTLMGLSGADVARLLPEIEAFAEVGRYFDEPVRTYSSGMQMRVAFSVATAVRPDVLIVDEALAVGDAYFIHKSYQRIREFRDAGTALLIVSHDPVAIQSLCDRAILLENGRVMMEGLPSEVLDFYNARIAEKENATVRSERREGHTVTESGTGEASFTAIELLDETGLSVEHVVVGQFVSLRARVRIRAAIPRLVFGYMLRDRLGQPIYGTNTDYTGHVITGLISGDDVVFEAAFEANLGPGSYSVSVALSSTETHLVNNYEWKDLALVFTVANPARPVFVGCAYIPAQISVSRVSGASSTQPHGLSQQDDAG
ncbi:ABC transporter ATP-binding protein [Cognatilysobacter bugurensis]|uniref:Sugar ABC transporter ATP-binding protein n=1 Tax=Cognatilysobacter bugurensis TaxID=543356 RepID=A0A918T5L0_9GAMM|nr:ABC transporter ATP-binding protein [Lysobacter bugurensis]GHA85696.1 sugar ABC transporter ATP-binding protein [Lysobacter bugurensis]